MRKIGKELRRSIRRDRRERIRRVSVGIENRLKEGDVIGAFATLRHLYRKFTGRALKPSEPEMEKTREMYVDLFKSDNLSDEVPYDFDYEGRK